MISKSGRLAPGLTDELVEPRLHDRAVALLVDVEPVAGAPGLPVDQHPEPHGAPTSVGRYQIQVAGVKAKRDPSAGLVQHGGLSATVQSPESAHWLSPSRRSP